MKLFKDKYDITLNEVSLMLETNNPRLLCHYKRIPSFLVARAFARFMVEFTELFNRDEVCDLLSDDFMRLKIINRITNLYRPLYYMLMNTNDKRFRDIYKKHFNKEYTGLSDLKLIITEIERLKGKYKEMGVPGAKLQSKETIGFEKIVTYTEMVLDRNMPGDMRLYQFKQRYDLAVKRAKEWESKNG